jgi:hypothetical protein
MVTLANNQPHATHLTRGLRRRDTMKLGFSLELLLHAVDRMRVADEVPETPLAGRSDDHAHAR